MQSRFETTESPPHIAALCPPFPHIAMYMLAPFHMWSFSKWCPSFLVKGKPKKNIPGDAINTPAHLAWHGSRVTGMRCPQPKFAQGLMAQFALNASGACENIWDILLIEGWGLWALHMLLHFDLIVYAIMYLLLALALII